MKTVKQHLIAFLTVGALLTACEGGSLLVPPGDAPAGDATGDIALNPDSSTNAGTTVTDPTVEAPVVDTATTAPVTDTATTTAPETTEAVETPADTSTTTVAAVDADADGFAADVDCDDNNADVNPDAKENYFAGNGGAHADSIDNDCDGTVDEKGLCDCNALKDYMSADASTDETVTAETSSDDTAETSADTSSDTARTSRGHKFKVGEGKIKLQNLVKNGPKLGKHKFKPALKGHRVNICNTRVEEFKTMPGWDCVDRPVSDTSTDTDTATDGTTDTSTDDTATDDSATPAPAETAEYIAAYDFGFKLLNKANSDVDLKKNWADLTVRIEFAKDKDEGYLECSLADMASESSTANKKDKVTKDQTAGIVSGSSMIVSGTVIAATTGPVGWVVGGVVATVGAVTAGVYSIEALSPDKGASFNLIYDAAYLINQNKCRGSFKNGIEEYQNIAQLENIKNFSIRLNKNQTTSLGIQKLVVKAIMSSDTSTGVTFYDNPNVESYVNNTGKNLKGAEITEYPNHEKDCMGDNVQQGFQYDMEAGLFNIDNHADGTGTKQGILYYPVSPKLMFTPKDIAVTVKLTAADKAKGLATAGSWNNILWSFEGTESCPNSESRRVQLFKAIESGQTKTAYFYTSALSDGEISNGGSISINDDTIDDTLYVNSVTAYAAHAWSTTGQFKHIKVSETSNFQLSDKDLSHKVTTESEQTYDEVKRTF